MGITVSDIQRAILGGGDVSVFAEIWHRALVNPPVPSMLSLEAPVALPETTAMLKYVDKNLKSVVVAWVEGREYRRLPKAKIDLTLIGLAPCGRNIGSYLAQVIDEVEPDIIVIDTSPMGLSANMLYAFGIPCAVGLPACGEILVREDGQFYASETFYPGNMNEIAIIKSWLMKIPLLPVGIPQRPKHSEAGSRLGFLSGTSMDEEISNSNVLAAYRVFDESIRDITTLREGVKITNDICPSLMKSIDNKIRETLVEESCYIASRIMEADTCTNTKGRKIVSYG